ncbi:MAG TPA: metallophosphoesterase family protein [Phycisphaerae bacterium]|jgi:hypothetical protein
MRIGVLADIHECTDRLRQAIHVLRGAGADAYVVLGDTADTCQEIDATAGLLRDVGAVGVWGNHDISLCRDVDSDVAARLAPETLTFMGSLEAQIVLDDCLFTHVEPWLDPFDVAHLWYFDGRPDTPEKLARSFQAVPQRRILIGHFHRWLAATPRGVLDWSGGSVLSLDPADRYLIVVGGVCDGRFAILDTAADRLVPYALG